MSDAREQAIEVLRQVFYDRGVLLPGQMASPLPAEVLDALLAATQDEPCETCDGRGWVPRQFPDGAVVSGPLEIDCPDCTNGRCAGTVPLVLLGPRAIVLSGGNYPPEGGPTVYCDDARARLLPEEADSRGEGRAQ